MTLLQGAETLAAILWCYAGLNLLAWLNATRKLERRGHIPAITDLLSHLVPAMLLLVVLVLFGALFGLVSTVVLIAVVFPGGLAIGGHMALAELTEREAVRDHLPRMGAAMLLGLAVTLYRFSV